MSLSVHINLERAGKALGLSETPLGVCFAAGVVVSVYFFFCLAIAAGLVMPLTQDLGAAMSGNDLAVVLAYILVPGLAVVLAILGLAKVMFLLIGKDVFGREFLFLQTGYFADERFLPAGGYADNDLYEVEPTWLQSFTLGMGAFALPPLILAPFAFLFKGKLMLMLGYLSFLSYGLEGSAVVMMLGLTLFTGAALTIPLHLVFGGTQVVDFYIASRSSRRAIG
ncbi:hypothetical protein [Maricaulis parjimensis]|uniref:hypothetical protein n=1 Tax=Maricaulis parjimensis TaxID=144023 RepID=UPI001939F36A|nr:hypothetical protein [Maricaulis parjimensis]